MTKTVIVRQSSESQTRTLSLGKSMTNNGHQEVSFHFIKIKIIFFLQNSIPKPADPSQIFNSIAILLVVLPVKSNRFNCF